MHRRKFTKDVTKFISTGVILSSGQIIASCNDEEVDPEGTLRLQIPEDASLVAGENFPISWTSNGVAQIDLAYRIDQAVNYLTFERNVPANSGSYDFAVPENINGGSLTFRITDSATDDILAEGVPIQLLFKWLIDLTQTSELDNIGGFVKVTEVNNPFTVRKTGAESYFALSLICTHQGCVVNVQNAGDFACPCHGSTYTQEGEVTNGPAEQPLQTLRTELISPNELVVFYS